MRLVSAALERRLRRVPYRSARWDGRRVRSERASTELTERELEIFDAYCDADTVEEAARRSGVSVQTVKNTVSEVLRKTGSVSSRQAAYRLWRPRKRPD